MVSFVHCPVCDIFSLTAILNHLNFFPYPPRCCLAREIIVALHYFSSLPPVAADLIAAAAHLAVRSFLHRQFSLFHSPMSLCLTSSNTHPYHHRRPRNMWQCMCSGLWKNRAADKVEGSGKLFVFLRQRRRSLNQRPLYSTLVLPSLVSLRRYECSDYPLRHPTGMFFAVIF